MNPAQSTSGYPPPGWAMLQDDLLTRGVLLRRVLAWVLDIMLIGILCWAMWVSLAVFTVITFGFGAPLLAGVSTIPALYMWLGLISGLQATPGQAAFGLIVVRDDDLGPPSALQALLCVLGYYVTIALGVLWAAVALVTARRRTLHDMVSGLVVVRRRAFENVLNGAGSDWNREGRSSTSSGGTPYA